VGQLKRFLGKKNDNYLKVKAHYDSGMAFLRNERYVDAIFQFDRALALDPDYGGGMYYLAYCLRNIGQLDKALYWAKKAVAAMPDDSEANYLMGSILCDRGEFDRALESYKAALETNDDPQQEPMIHMALAYVYMQLAMRKEATQAYEKVLKLKPDHCEAHAFLGGIYLDQGDFEQAVEHLERAGREDSSVQQNLAWALWQLGEREQAISILRDAIERSTEDGQLYSLLGSFLFEARHFEEALLVLERAVDLSAEPDKELYLLGSTFRELGLLDKALETYQRLLKESPEDASLLTTIGYIYAEQNDLEQALEVWQRAVSANPTDIGAKVALAYGLYLNEDLETALNVINEALALDPDYDVAHLRKGYILKALNDVEAAVNEFEKAVSLGQTEALLDLANLYRKSGNIGKARKCIEQFMIEAQKEDSDRLVNLGNYLEEAQAILEELE